MRPSCGTWEEIVFKVLLYYKYIQVDDPEQLRNAQFALCERLGLKGRILVAHEGLNGTVCGEPEAIEQYILETTKDERFNDVVFKESESAEQVFPRLRVVVRNEIVTLGAEGVTFEEAAPYVEPEELNALLESGEEVYLVDARNNYESVVGKFDGAITPDIGHFREFPAAVKEMAHLKKKKVVTYCTGGVRCEKASALMKKEGFENVYQLHGGIVTYGNKFPDGKWLGKCYVFDKRLMVDVNTPEKEVLVSTCKYCTVRSARMINCSNADCDEQFVCCAACEQEQKGFCSERCAQSFIKARPQSIIAASL